MIDEVWLHRAGCVLLMASTSSCLLIGDVDEEPANIGPFPTSSLLALLSPHRYQLTNDGIVQFGLIDERPDAIAEILGAPTKHFKVWANDEKALRTAVARHGLEQARQLRFLDGIISNAGVEYWFMPGQRIVRSTNMAVDVQVGSSRCGRSAPAVIFVSVRSGSDLSFWGLVGRP